MTDKETAQAIVEKYHNDFAELQNNATAQELKTFFKIVADEANQKQRKIAGLD